MPQAKFGFAHPYFMNRDPERRWLFRLELTVPTGVSGFATVGGPQGITSSTGGQVLSFNAQSVTLPSVNLQEITIPHMNQDVKVAGRPTLGDMTVAILNSYDQQAVRVIEAWQLLIYRPSTEQLGFAANYKTNGSLVVYKPDFSVFKAYDIKGCWPASIGDIEYDWSSSDSVIRNVTFHVDKVYYQDDGANQAGNSAF